MRVDNSTPFGAGESRKPILHMALKVHGQIPLRAGLVELAALTAGKINLRRHVVVVRCGLVHGACLSGFVLILLPLAPGAVPRRDDARLYLH